MRFDARPQHACVGPEWLYALQTNPFGLRMISCLPHAKHEYQTKSLLLNLSETISWGVSSPENRVALVDSGMPAIYIADLGSILLIRDPLKGGLCDFIRLEWPSNGRRFVSSSNPDEKVDLYQVKDCLVASKTNVGMRLYDWKRRELLAIDAPNVRFSPLPAATAETTGSGSRFLAQRTTDHAAFIVSVEKGEVQSVQDVTSETHGLREYNEFGIAPPLSDSHFDVLRVNPENPTQPESWRSLKSSEVSPTNESDVTQTWTGNTTRGLVRCKSNHEIEVSDPNRRVRTVIRGASLEEREDDAPTSSTSWIWAGFSSDETHPYLYTLQKEVKTTEAGQLEESGLVRAWQIDSHALNSSLNTWLRHTGASKTTAGAAREHVDSDKQAPDVKAPKHGKEDDLEHYGGNTYAGGTGGSDTAGLGGRGGPYRLDKGKFKVRQMKDLPKHSQMSREAREMNRRVFNERMRAIGMSTQQSAIFQEMSERVSSHVHDLIDVLDTVAKKRRETQWLKRQSFGELDETRLVDMIVGERDVFKRRSRDASEKPNWWDLPTNPGDQGEDASDRLHVRVAFDVSGSMYRFQSLDGRLTRELETALMLMSAFQGKNDTLKYTFVGHSGEDPVVDLGVSSWDAPSLKTELEYFKVLETMTAHSQFCHSGDTTIEATYACVESCLQLPTSADAHYVPLAIVVSDANLRRYGIAPKTLRDAMESAPRDRVKTHAVFIASLADEAEALKRELPPGQAHVATRPEDVPRILRDIISSSVQA